MLMQSPKAFAEIEQITFKRDVENPEAFTKTGLTAGTMVETATGWRSVASLSVGERIGTWDGGLARLTALRRSVLTPARADQMILVPGGALGNCSDLLLTPRQPVMIESAEAEKLLGEAHVLVAAEAMIGFRGITQQSATEQLEVIHLGFDDEEVIFANTGALLHCGFGRRGDFFTLLSDDRARALLSLMDADLGFLDALAV